VGTIQSPIDWSTSLFQGVDFSKTGRQDVQFTLTRDAGKIDCEGYSTR